MGLLCLSLRQFRCFAAADLRFAPGFNLIVGQNASGKTSLLEAIFLLSRGRSFRTARLENAIQTNFVEFRLAGEISGPTAPIPIGLVRRNGELHAKIAGETPENLAQLAEIFPVQLIDNHAYQLVRNGPRQRRQFLDWGVFHVEPGFFQVWRRYQRARRQRNTALRTGRSQKEVTSWDSELVSTGEALDAFRRRYMASMSVTATAWASQALGGTEISLEYRPGWPEAQSLMDALRAGAKGDRLAGRTQAGPHRAEMLIRINGKAAQEWASRGQEKALAGALLLAQAAVYKELTGHVCTLLLDDLAAELDAEHLRRFMEKVEETDAQICMTAIEPPASIARKAASVFHVKQGEIREMV
ncbi:MAG: DNA replication/repair protein RecF [Gammaproteobacteria bacterium]